MSIVNAAQRKCIVSPIDLKLEIIGNSKTAFIGGCGHIVLQGIFQVHPVDSPSSLGAAIVLILFSIPICYQYILNQVDILITCFTYTLSISAYKHSFTVFANVYMSNVNAYPREMQLLVTQVFPYKAWVYRTHPVKDNFAICEDFLSVWQVVFSIEGMPEVFKMFPGICVCLVMTTARESVYQHQAHPRSQLLYVCGLMQARSTVQFWGRKLTRSRNRLELAHSLNISVEMF